MLRFNVLNKFIFIGTLLRSQILMKLIFIVISNTVETNYVTKNTSKIETFMYKLVVIK